MWNFGAVRSALLVAIGSALIATIACGGGANKMPPTNAYVYVAQEQASPTQPDLWTGSIAQLKVDGNGGLGKQQPSTVSAGTVPGSMAVDPSGRYLLISEEGTIAEYAIASDGTLTRSAPTGIVTGVLFTFTPDGRYLISTGAGSNGLPLNTLGVFSFRSDGLLTLVSSTNIASQTGPIAVDVSSRFVYFGSQNDNRIYEYSLSAEGELTPTGSVAGGSVSPFWLPASPNGFLYSPINGPGGMLGAFRINPNDGSLAQGSNFALCSLAVDYPITFTPSGKYAYASCGGTLSQFSVDEVTGVFVPNGPDLPSVGGITMDSSGKFGFAFTDVDTVTKFVVGPDGTLSPDSGLVLSTSMLGQSIVSTHR
jgi:6-phosphogluconolactonase (cycloisomerase 2 family)